MLVTIGLIFSVGLAANTALGVVTFSAGPDQGPLILDDGPSFANVGLRESVAGGVYVGDGWVLTAKHVGVGDITFNGVTYHYEDGTAHFIENPSGYYRLNSTYTDLVLFHLTEEPDLPSLKIASAPPSTGTKVYLAGNGIEHEDTLSYWTVNTGSWVWSETSSVTQYWGYKPAGTCELNWGTNQVMGSYGGPGPSTCYLSVSGTDSVVFKTRFDAQEPYEAQAVGGDSGGGVFYWDEGDGWVLAGIISCVETFPNTPTKAIAGAKTCSVDLSFYQNQILDIITPEEQPHYILGDINKDGIVDSSDATILAMYWGQTTTEGSAVGDFNGDGIIDGSDATILASHWMETSDDSCDMEWNEDEYETVFQYAILPDNPAVLDVPEPATWLLLLSLGMASIGWNRLRKIHR